MNLYSNADSETKQYLTKCDVWLCRPPLGDCRYCSLNVLSTDTIALLAVLAFGWSSSDLTSSGLSSADLASGLSSSDLALFVGTGNDSSLRVREVVDGLGVWFEQSHHIFWFVLL